MFIRRLFVFFVLLPCLGSSSFAHVRTAIAGIYKATNAANRSRNAAARACTEGDRLRAEQNAQSNKKAIDKYEEALTYWRAAGDKAREAKALTEIGDLWHLVSDDNKAIVKYNRALVVSRALRDIRLESEILSKIGLASIYLGRNHEALEYCTRALQLGRETDSKALQAQALNGLGEAYTFLGELLKALDYYHQALPLWNALNDKKGQAQTKLYLGYSYTDLADVRSALSYYNEALELWRSVNDRRGEALTLIATGHLRSKVGEKQEALNIFNQALGLIQAIGDKIWIGSTIAGIAYIYDGLGEKRRALVDYRQMLRLYQSIGFRKGEANAFFSMGRIHKSLGETQQALANYESGLSIVRSIGDRRLEAYGLKYLGGVYDAAGEKDKALDLYSRARLLYKDGGDKRGVAAALNSIGNIYLERGDNKAALDLYREALSLNRESSERFEESSTLYNIARAQRDMESPDDARKTIEAALDLNETFRATVSSQELRASYFASVQQNYELYIDLLMRSNKLHPKDGLAAAALTASERARARSLIEMLSEVRADIRQGVDASLLQNERSLQQSLTEKEERYSRLLMGKHTDEQATTAAKEIEEIRTDYQQVQAQIRSTSPRYAALTQPQPLTLKEIQDQVLDSDTMLLEYALGDDRSYLWAVTPDSLTSFELPKRADIEAAARRVYDLLTVRNSNVTGETALRKEGRVARANADYSNAAAALSQMVIGPVASQLGTKRLLIVADGALQYIPFGALPVPGATGMAGRTQASDRQENEQAPDPHFQPLIVEHEIVSLPSASTLAVMRRELVGRKPAPKAVAVLADPVFSRLDPRVNSSRTAASRQGDAVSMPRDFERAIKEVRVSRNRSGVARLPFSRAEAAAIKAAAPAGQAMEAIDFDASRATAASEELSQYRIIHFATHGLLNSEHPELSGMVFSLVDRHGKSQNGFLRLHEVYNLNLPAELVVLSACQTGLGKDVKGEGLVGLTRGFMYAGAARVVASLWQVDDSATAELMKRFYAKMLGDGLRPAAALRDAQVEMWKQKRWQAPYYWAGFMLQGEWK